MIRRLLRLWPHPGVLVKLGVVHLTLAVGQGALLGLLAPILRALLRAKPDFDAATPALVIGGCGVVAYWALAAYATPVGFAASMRLTADARRLVVAHAGTLPFGWFDARNKARLARVATTATGDLGRLVAQIGPQVIGAVAVPATLVVVASLLDWRFGLLLLAVAPLAVVTLRWSGRVFAAASAELDEAATELAGRAVEVGQAQPVLRVAGRGGDGGRLLRAALDEHRRRYRAGLRRSLPPSLSYVAVIMLAFVAVLALGARLALAGDVPTADLIALLVLAARFLESLGSLSGLLGGLRVMESALGRVEAVLATAPLPIARPAVTGLRDSGVEFENVTFGYGATPALREVSFRCPPGSTTALVGPSGSGKTTATRLIARFFDVQSGKVRVGGVDVRQLHPDTLAQAIAVVFQDVYLFDATIEENVRMAHPRASAAEFAAAAEAACLREVVERLPAGWRTRVGEGGAKLSGGERQRVSIARAFIKQAPLVLLDEASSALDPENENGVQRAIANICAAPGRTVVMIAHQPATLASADRVVSLDGGVVVESGPREELLAAGGVFARLCAQGEQARAWRVGHRV